MRNIVLITSRAPSLTNFRAPLIRLLPSQGILVFALAPNFEESTRAAVRLLGATPVDCPIARTGMNPLRDAVNTWRMARLLPRLKPDVSLGYFIKAVIFGTLAAWWAGIQDAVSAMAQAEAWFLRQAAARTHVSNSFGLDRMLASYRDAWEGRV